MPRRTLRQQKTDHLIQGCLVYYKWRKLHTIRKKLRLKNKKMHTTTTDNVSTEAVTGSCAHDDTISTVSSNSASQDDSTSESDFSVQSLGLDSSSDGMSIGSSSGVSSNSRGSESSSSSDSSSSASSSGDELGAWEDIFDESHFFPSTNSARRHRSSIFKRIATSVASLHAIRYHAPRTGLRRAPALLPHVLSYFKKHRPDHFCQELRITPRTFDALVKALERDPVFENNSQNKQMPVKHQIMIALYRFGHSGNSCSLDKVAKWAGYAKGTILLATKRVMTAILRPEFLHKYVRLPTAEEKEEAKTWIEQHSCHAWRDGWCMVDGTLVALYERPIWYGDSYFDRKSNYSLNFQIVNLPNLRIIDFGYGFTGSMHDATAWEETSMYRNHAEIFGDGEFIWGDSAYPIQTWVVAPFRRPESEDPNNRIFNNHVSMVRIRSEHAIGFLKGRFQSLKSLRINIRDRETHMLATYWVICCIVIHNFAMEHEAVEAADARQGRDDDDTVIDPFILEGLEPSHVNDFEAGTSMVVTDHTMLNHDSAVPAQPQTSRRARTAQLEAAREFREHLKEELFREREEQHSRRRRFLHGE